MNNLKILVVYPGRFGFHVVSYFLCKYASRRHDVSYLGVAFSQTKNCNTSEKLPTVRVREHECKSGIFGRAEVLRIIKAEVVAGGYDVVFTAYIPGISLLKRFFRKSNVQAIVDIRSGFLAKSSLKRLLLNRILRFECRKFRYRTINSELLGSYLGFSRGEVTELPLGAEPVSSPARTFDGLHLLYVGALSKRNVEITVRGLKAYVDRFGTRGVKKYDIVGAGSIEDERIIKDAIRDGGLEGIVEMHGYVSRENMGLFLQAANVGVSFVPMTPYYDMQPVTKSYEFLLAGLPLLATRTTQNIRHVNAANGVLIDDTAESVSQGLAKLASKFSENAFDSDRIRKAFSMNSWGNVITEHYVPYLEKVFLDQDVSTPSS